MITAEHWTNEARDEHTLLLSTASEKDRKILLVDTPVKCCEAEAPTWEQCVAWYEEYVFPGEDRDG